MTHEYFICHSSADKDLAEEAASALETAGRTTWFAPRDIPEGASWPAYVNQALRDANAVLLIGTEAGFNSKHVNREIAVADRYGKSVLPIIVDDAEVPPDVSYYMGSLPELRASRGQVAATLRQHFAVADS